ncbi:MAG: sensor histidine kinase [Chitinophagaceae bacterium]
MTSKKISCIFLLLLFVARFSSFSQTPRVDSLKKILLTEKEDKQKLQTLLNLCKEQSSLSADTLYHYAIAAKSIANEEKDDLKAGMAQNYIGLQFLTRGSTDSSLAISQRLLATLHYNDREKELYTNLTLLKARSLNNLNRPKEALDLLYPLLAVAEKNEDTLIQIRTINAMAAAFVGTDDDKQAQRWCYKALQLYPTPIAANYEEAYGITLNNIALTFIHLHEKEVGKNNNLDSAKYYTAKALEVNSKSGYLGSLAYTLGLRGTLLGFNNNVPKGEQLLIQSVATYRQIGNVFNTANAMSMLGNFYGITNQPQKGIAICKEGIELNKNSRPNIFLYQNLAGNYKLAGDYKLYGETLEKLLAIKDSLHQKNSAQAVSEMQTRYETQKKENIIIQQQYALTKKNYIVYGALVLLLIGTIFSIILIIINRKKQEFKFQALQKEEKRLHEIAVSKAEENERNRIAAELHDNLGGQLSYISSNMDFILEAPASMTEEQKSQHLTKINETAKSTIADLRESIWALKKPQVEIDELADKIKLYIQNQLSHQDSIQLDVNESIIQKSTLSSPEALNVFRICQEAIHNAIKHSSASKIILSIENGDEVAYNISIKDNGTGFNTKEQFKDHYGLENIYQRAKDIHAVLNISSVINSGTTVTLTRNVNNSTNELLPNQPIQMNIAL